MKPTHNKPISPETLIKLINKAEEGYDDQTDWMRVDRKVYMTMVRMAKDHVSKVPELEKKIAELELALADCKQDKYVITKDSSSPVYCNKGFTSVHQEALGCLVADSDYSALEKFMQYKPRLLVRDNRIVAVMLCAGLVSIPKTIPELECLEILNLNNNKITDISPLLKLGHLNRLLIKNNSIDYNAAKNKAVVEAIEARKGRVYK
jgi:hypothetical protein